MTELEQFIDKRLFKINGFLHPTDAMCLASLGQYQSQAGIVGGIAEIGVFYGRSFCLMAKMLKDEEGALAIDLFDIDVDRSGRSGQLEAFLAMLDREGISKETYSYIAGDSGKVSPDEIFSRVGKVRMFSVDGGHEYYHVESDSRLALQCIAEQGAIIFDDFMNPQYPDLSVCVIDFLRTNDVIPFCITKNKLYVCKAERHQQYLEATRHFNLWAGATRETFKFLDSDISFVNQSLANRAIYQVLSEHGQGQLAKYFTRAGRRKYSR
jgi:hypothetical protein